MSDIITESISASYMYEKTKLDDNLFCIILDYLDRANDEPTVASLARDPSRAQIYWVKTQEVKTITGTLTSGITERYMTYTLHNGLLHSVRDQSAFSYPIFHGFFQVWCKFGVVHRERGPAVASYDRFHYVKEGKIQPSYDRSCPYGTDANVVFVVERGYEPSSLVIIRGGIVSKSSTTAILSQTQMEM